MTEQNIDGILIKRVVSEMEKLGIPKNMSGYTFLRKALLKAYHDFHKVYAIMKLYTEIASEHESTAGRVERCIRHAIESSEGIAKFYPSRPTTQLLIAEIADRLRVEDGII